MALALGSRLAAADPPLYPWLAAPVEDTVEGRVPPPPGFRRVTLSPRGFGAWLRGLPVKPGRPDVRLHDGRLKDNQEAHHVVLDVDVGRRDLQQCADAVIRLRAEYLRAAGLEDSLCFRFTNGAEARWRDWRNGLRPQASGPRLVWRRGAPPDADYPSFRRYLEAVFVFAGSASLARELVPVPDPRAVEPGDVAIQGGFPGHAVLVVDAAEDGPGRRAVLLAQSYMPAQEIHVLRNPGDAASPWYRIGAGEPLVTPEWTFPPGSLRRFTGIGCPPIRTRGRMRTPRRM